MGDPRLRPVAIVGAGLTGASWAGLFAAHGFRVRLYDARSDALDLAMDRARQAAEFLSEHDLADASAVGAGLAALTATADPAAALAGVGHVQECVREDLELKRAVFRQVDELAPADALIATSSSGLSISDIQTAASRPQRCLAAHPYNPPHIVPLVELAPGALTDPHTLERAFELFRAAGKQPVRLRRDVPGYIANRLSAALWREAVELVRSGVASVEDVDCAVAYGPGLRWAAMGPHLIYDLGGGLGGIREHMEHLAHVKEGMLRDIAHWQTFPADTAEILAAGLEEEKGGRSYEELVRERDELLAGYLTARRKLGIE